ncbi:MAG: hypothetical protein ACYDCC_12615 [Actinomycetota bacterium]
MSVELEQDHLDYGAWSCPSCGTLNVLDKAKVTQTGIVDDIARSGKPEPETPARRQLTRFKKFFGTAIGVTVLAAIFLFNSLRDCQKTISFKPVNQTQTAANSSSTIQQLRTLALQFRAELNVYVKNPGPSPQTATRQQWVQFLDGQAKQLTQLHSTWNQWLTAFNSSEDIKTAIGNCASTDSKCDAQKVARYKVAGTEYLITQDEAVAAMRQCFASTSGACDKAKVQDAVNAAQQASDGLTLAIADLYGTSASPNPS